ncbi:hypothetical protein Tco_1499283 [Tanacetum coccineum]
MVNAQYKEVLKATNSKHVETMASDADSAIRKAIPFYINETSNNMREQIRKEFEELKKNEGLMRDAKNDKATYRDFTACEIPICCEEGNKVNFAANFLHDSAKTWWDGKICKKGEYWKFNDMVPYCPKYHGNKKLKDENFQRILKDDIHEVISPIKCTTLKDLLGRARIREVDLVQKKNNGPNKQWVCLKCDLLSDDWIVDSGCTKHMIGNRRLFTSYKAYDGGHVVLGAT